MLRTKTRTLTRLLRAAKSGDGTNKRPSLKLAIDRYLYKRVVDDVSEKDIQIEEARVLRLILRKRKEMFERRKASYRLEAVHPSQISGCPKEAVFRMLQAPRDQIRDIPDDIARTQRIFDNGDYLHLRLQCLFIMMGISTIDDIEIEFHRRDEDIAGTCDGRVRFKGWRAIVEIKSINNRGFTEIVRKNKPKPEHVEQANVYMWALDMATTYILYENKDTQKLHECIVVRNDKLIAELIARAKKTMTHVRKKTLPTPRPFDNPSAPPCAYCRFTNVCFSGMKEKAWLKTLRKGTRLQT